MFLVDKEIKEMCKSNLLIINNYNEKNVGAVSYDLTIEDIIMPGETHTAIKSYELAPQETIFVSTLEIIKIPNNFLGIVSEKNSVMREGLMIAAPYYQPGHQTKCFIRVTNLSGNIITLSSGKSIAQILFDKLDSEPEKPYSKNAKASYNNEFAYRGFGKYADIYQKEIKSIVKKAEDSIDEKANSIYANVLTFMGIIAAIFTIITINFEAFTKQEFSKINILSINLSLAFVISVLMGIILIFFNKKRAWWTYVIFAVIAVTLLVTNILICGI